MKIAILSNSKNKRGAEIWAELVKEKLSANFKVSIYSDISGELNGCISSEMVIPINGRLQALVSRLITWITRKPLIIFGHSGPGADDKWNLLCSPNVFVAFSDYQKQWAEKYKLPWTKVIKISHAVDLTKFSPVNKKPKWPHPKSDEKIVLCVAANDPDKRIGLVREAVKKIADARFILVGNGNPIKANFNEMPEIYKKADVFCLVPETWEAFGLVFLEALATNLPVVTINDSVRREIVGDAGILVDNPENSEKLAKAINTALQTNWGNKPRQQAEKFSWEKITKEYEELFLNITK